MPSTSAMLNSVSSDTPRTVPVPLHLSDEVHAAADLLREQLLRKPCLFPVVRYLQTHGYILIRKSGMHIYTSMRICYQQSGRNIIELN